MKNRRQFIRESALAGLAMSMGVPATLAKEKSRINKDLRLGIIGLDTSHCPAFAKYINDPEKESMKGVSVVVAYPYGSLKIESSASKIPEYTSEFEKMGIEIASDIASVLKKVDGILLETNDGNMHLEQAIPVLKAGKPLFIDKPVAGNLTDVIRIFEAAKKYKTPIFSSSALRYLKKAQEIRQMNTIGDIMGADTYSPEKWEPSHTDLYWYGIHGIELLYTLMGTGCTEIRRTLTENTDMVTGKWNGERLGTFRGDLHGRQNYGGTAFGTKGVTELGQFEGYDALVEKIVDFMRTGISPVDAAETLELYTFMEAADVSKQLDGAWVSLKDVYDKAYKEALK